MARQRTRKTQPADSDVTETARIADELAAFAAAVLDLPGVSRHRPHAFLEEKSELAGRMLQRAAELRGDGAARASRSGAPN